MAREITLATPTEVEVVAARTETVSSLKLVFVADYGNKVEAQVQFPTETKNYTLWDSTTTPTYEGIGQWTDANVDARLKELI